MHLAHKRLIDQAELIVVIERNRGYLTPGYKRSIYAGKPCAFYLFDKIKSLTPKGFVEQLKEDFPLLEKIVVGYDFHFGKEKSGNAEHLKELFGGEVLIVDEVSKKGIPVHSRTIRQYLKEGNITMATELLGRCHIIDGQIISGQGLGKKELVPTLNLLVKHYQLPLEGVYASKTKIKNKWLSSVSFLGHRVTTDDSFAVETHILDSDIGIIKGITSIKFIAFIRENKKFNGLDALRQAIGEDIEEAKKF